MTMSYYLQLLPLVSLYGRGQAQQSTAHGMIMTESKASPCLVEGATRELLPPPHFLHHTHTTHCLSQ